MASIARPYLLLTPAFGIALGASFLVGWLLLDRAITGRTLTAFLCIAAAGAVSAALAVIAAHLLRRRPWSARFAAVLIVLTAGTVGLAAMFMAAPMAWGFHHLTDLSIRIVLLVLAIQAASALYGFLTVAGPLMLPLWIPLTAAFALFIARPPR
jgi:hypothetical protein